MKKTIQHAFLRRWRDRAAGLLAAVVAVAPVGMPRELADWIAQQVPWCPTWIHWVAAVGIVVWRLDAGRRAAS